MMTEQYIPWNDAWNNRYCITRRLLGVSRGYTELDSFFKSLAKGLSLEYIRAILKETPDRIYVKFYKSKNYGLGCLYLVDHPDKINKQKNSRIVFDKSRCHVVGSRLIT